MGHPPSLSQLTCTTKNQIALGASGLLRLLVAPTLPFFVGSAAAFELPLGQTAQGGAQALESRRYFGADSAALRVPALSPMWRCVGAEIEQ